MIIENKIDKIKLQDSMKLFIKYAMLDQTKKVKKLIIIGAGGHGRVVADIAQKLNTYESIEFLDEKVRKQHSYHPGKEQLCV